jgi:hypothetical protein
MNAICHLTRKGYIMNKNAAKKRLMFIQKEDYNFLAYNILILLDTLGCTDEKKKFRDFRKIAYLVDFINEGGNLQHFDQAQLAQIYSRAQIKKKLLHHLMIVLKNREFIGVSVNTTYRSIDLWLNKSKIPNNFLDADFFKSEIANIMELKKITRSLKTVSIKTLATVIFNDNNVLTWEI